MVWTGPQQTWLSHCPGMLHSLWPQFPVLERMQPLSKFLSSLTFHSLLLLLLLAGFFVSTLSCSGRASPGSALFCFCGWTYYRRTPGSAAQSAAEEASSFAQFLAALVWTEKVGRGQLAEATEIAAQDSPMSRRKVGTQDPAICWALSLTKVSFGTHRHQGFPGLFPSGQRRQLCW